MAFLNTLSLNNWYDCNSIVIYIIILIYFLLCFYSFTCGQFQLINNVAHNRFLSPSICEHFLNFVLIGNFWKNSVNKIWMTDPSRLFLSANFHFCLSVWRNNVSTRCVPLCDILNLLPWTWFCRILSQRFAIHGLQLHCADYIRCISKYK